jgi:hypothetical protein
MADKNPFKLPKLPKIPGLSFSWKRAIGLTRLRQNIARKTGIPTTKNGIYRKIGRAVTGGGCLVTLTAGAGLLALLGGSALAYG